MLVSSVPSLVPATLEAPEGDPILVVQDLNKVYSQRRFLGAPHTVAAVKDVSFSVRPKEILGIVGESGSGKSTLARCIARLIDPTSGTVQIDGADIAQITRREFQPLRKRIQIVFQDPYRSLNGRMRIGQSIVEGMLNFGSSRKDAETRAIELLELVGLDAAAMRRYPHQFSGGQRQRICIARALALSPDILIADEAVSALDVSVQAQVLALLEEIRVRTHIAVLFITHDLRVAAQICNTILVMQRGTVVEAASAQRVLTDPHHAYTRQLIEAAPGRHWDFRHFRALHEAA